MTRAKRDLFELRLKILLILFSTCWLIVALRLLRLQSVDAPLYEELAEQRLIHQEKYLEPLRGRILDCTGQVLAADTPAWSIAVHFGLLQEDDEYYHSLARKLIRDAGYKPNASRVERVTQELKKRRELLWKWMAEFAETTPEALTQRAQQIVQKVLRIKGSVEQRQKRSMTIAEEIQTHPLVTDLNHAQQMAARTYLTDHFLRFHDLKAVEIIDSRRRMYPGGSSFAHILGRLSPVTPAELDRNPFDTTGAYVDWSGYRPTDLIGTRGVEWLSEDRLRGKRGRLITFQDDRPESRREPEDGQDVRLTLNRKLQEELFALLETHVQKQDDIPGGSAVILNIATRNILAMTSYPAYDPDQWNRLYDQWREDTIGMPLRFRAVATQYAPGSIVKPVTVVAALSSGRIDSSWTHTCQGSLFPSHQDRWRCWRPAGSRRPMHHGTINSESAIQHSCNVFCFKLGELLGVDELCNWLDMFGVGRSTGIGLLEERYGNLPTSGWLSAHRQRPASVGDARNYAIGQGELEITPLQAVNLAACYASGVYTSVNLFADPTSKPTWQLPIDASTWQTIRRGMFKVVNDPEGTAYQHARLERAGYALCGKSGSAETSRWIVAYDATYRDTEDQVHTVRIAANTSRLAEEEFKRKYPEVASDTLKLQPSEYWPEYIHAGDRRHSHAWFIAFLQKRSSNGAPDWSQQPQIAIAVMLEFGGSGGRTSGPLCREIAELIIDDYSHYLTPTDSSVAIALPIMADTYAGSF